MKKLKTIAAMLLIFANVLSLCACGKTGGSSEPQATETPEYVYTADFKTLGTSKDYIDVRVVTDKGYYGSTSEKVGERIPEGAVPTYVDQYAIYAPSLSFTNFDGKTEKLANYKPMALPAGEEGKRNYTANIYLQSMTLTSSGDIVTVESISTSWFDGPEDMKETDTDYWANVKYEDTPYIRVLDTTGAEKSCAQLESNGNGYSGYYGSLYMDAEDNVIVSGDQCIRAVGLDGKEVYKISLPGDSTYIDYFVKTKSGQIGICIYDNGEKLYLLDSQAKTLSEPVDLSVVPSNLTDGGGQYDLYYTNGINLYGYSLETKSEEKLFSWLDMDVDDSNIIKTFVNAEGNLQCITNLYDDKTEEYTRESATVIKVPSNTVPHKDIIKLAVMYLDYDMKQQIYKFNRNNAQYRIQVTDYSEFNTDDDYTAGQTKLYTEIMAGNMPDIIGLNQLNYVQLANKGLLTDLYPYIEADKEISKKDFFPTVLKALEVNGGLYTSCASFSINTVVGSAKVVGDKPGWNIDQYNAALASMPEGCQPFDAYATKLDVLCSLLNVNMADFVDWSTGKCSFDSEAFIKLLKMTDAFPESVDTENEELMSQSINEQIAQGKQMLLRTSLYNLDSFMFDDYSHSFGGDFTYIGYPTETGTGNTFIANSGYAISSKSEHKDAAWQFLRVFFTKDFQKNDYTGLPTNMKVYDEKAQELMTVQYSKDVNGNYLLDDKGEKIPLARGSLYDEKTGETTEVYALSQEQINKVNELIDTTTRITQSSESIYKIVSDEAAAYFAGQKSAEEIARLIQSKANIYVNEQR